MTPEIFRIKARLNVLKNCQATGHSWSLVRERKKAIQNMPTREIEIQELEEKLKFLE